MSRNRNIRIHWNELIDAARNQRSAAWDVALSMVGAGLITLAIINAIMGT